MEDKDIEMLLNPILEESMKASLDTILEMKYQNLIEKGDIGTISFIKLFLEDAFEYYDGIKDMHNLLILNDLKQYLSELI